MMSNESKNAVLWLFIIIIIILALFGLYQLAGKFHKVPDLPASSQTAPASPAVASSTDSVPADWIAYSNASYNYHIKYPETIVFSKDVTFYDSAGTPTLYKANNPVKVSILDTSDIPKAAPNSTISVFPLYVSITAERKPKGFISLEKYISGEVDRLIAAGENSAAGVYATSAAFNENGMNGYMIIVSDGSVVKNRDDKYYFERGDYIYSFDMAYSGYYFETGDKDEVMRVSVAKSILSTFHIQ